MTSLPLDHGYSQQAGVRVLEQACIGAVIDKPEHIAYFLERLPLEHFDGNLFRIAKALADLATDDTVTITPMAVVEKLRVNGDLFLAGGAAAVFDCFVHGSKVIDPKQEIGTLSRLFALRDAWGVGQRLSMAVANMDLDRWVSYAEEQVGRIAKISEGSAPPVMTYLRDVLVGEDVSVEWCVPGLLPKGTATMLTAEEGVGKSTVLRQVAVSAMAGVSPFTPHGEKYQPQRVLLVDCEVSRSQLTRGLRSIWSYARQFNQFADTTVMAVESHQGGLNFSDAHDQAWLHRVVREHRADLLVVGPVYRFTDSDLNTEEGVRTWQRCFEPMLADGLSILTEHHAPNAAPGQTRALRPIGSSAMRRWFAQGIALRVGKCDAHEQVFCRSCPRSATVESWRGSRDEEARWPHFLKGEQGQVWWSRDEAREVAS